MACCNGKMLLSCKEIKLDYILPSGQSFSWKKSIDPPGRWTGVFANRVWILSQDNEHLYYSVYEPMIPTPSLIKSKQSKSQAKRNGMKPGSTQLHTFQDSVFYEKLLIDYFQLDVSLKALYSHWAEKDVNFEKISSIFPGIRQLRQDPVENLLSFICSSNNNIARISKMVDSLCSEYGDKITELDGVSYYDFPAPEKLAGKGVEDKLRKLGFGYRAKYISTTAKILVKNGGSKWLHDLRNESYETTRSKLLTLSGVGPKVADCVCLMSLDKTGAVPIDTHVLQVAKRDYGFKCDNKSITEKTYQQIGQYFRDLWGDYAGWAQSVLFSADLKMHQTEGTLSSKSKSNSKTTMKRKSDPASLNLSKSKVTKTEGNGKINSL